MRKKQNRRLFSIVLLFAMLFVSVAAFSGMDAYAAGTDHAAGQTTVTEMNSLAGLSGQSSFINSASIFSNLFKFRLNKTSVNGYVGDTTTLKAYNSSASVTWQSSDTSVASVSAKGVVTMNSPGTAVITAKSGSNSATCTVKVAGMAVSEITLKVGETYQLEIQNNSSLLTFWTSSDSKVASVGWLSGKVTAKAVGTSKITGSASGTNLL